MKKNKIVVITLALVFSLLFSIAFKWLQTGNPFSAETLLFGSIILLNILIIGNIAIYLFEKYAYSSVDLLKKNILKIYFAFSVGSLIISLFLVSMGVYAFYLIRGLDTQNFFIQLIKIELPSAIKQFSIWVLIGSIIFFYIIWRKAVERAQKLREENLKYKYQNLKSQVNPHFLFNSLNTLSEIVYQDAKTADKYIQNLSVIYRYILDNEETDLISLDKEIQFAKMYFEIQKTRDNEKITLDIAVQNVNDFQIIPVSLQILIENAIKHNARSVEKPLKIEVTVENEFVIVSNNIQLKNSFENSFKTGLTNLNERTKLILHKELIIKKENNQFIVKLPILKLKK